MKARPEFFVTNPHPCSYLGERLAQTVFLDPDSQPDQKDYSILVQNGFRRSGQHIYRPNCESCQACISVRLNVAAFTAGRRFKRILKANADLVVEHYPSDACPDFYRLYERYISTRHRDGDMFPSDPDQYAAFLQNNLGNCEFLAFRHKGETIAVAVTDILNDGLASVYSFFDPDYAARSLGTLAILYQVEYCKKRNLPYLYLGYWIKDCQKMCYKTDFQPLEYFFNGLWQAESP